MRQIAVLLTAAAAFAGPSAEPRDALLQVESSIDLSAPCKSKCKSCGPQNMGHELVASEEGPLTADPHKCDPLNPCDDKSVCDPHAPVPESDAMDDAEAVRVAIVERRYNDILSLANAHPERVTVNVERSAIQLVNCAGHVVAHYPIPRTAAAGIATMLD